MSKDCLRVVTNTLAVQDRGTAVCGCFAVLVGRLFVEKEGSVEATLARLRDLFSGDTLANDEQVVDLVPVQRGGGDPDDSGYASDDEKTGDRLAEVYYSPKGYWRGRAAIPKLAKASGVSGSRAEERLAKQAIWQIYLPAPR